MNEDNLQKVLRRLYDRKLTPKRAAEQLKTLPFEDLGFAKIDHHRPMRSGTPEVIYCKGKSADQIVLIIKRMVKAGSNVLATRLEPDVYKKLQRRIPKQAKYRENSRTLIIENSQKRKKMSFTRETK